MAFTYDFLRLFRRLLPHGRFWVDMEDLLYWTACFLASFYLLYYGNNGVIRFFAVLGAGTGMLLYGATIGRFFVKGSFRLITLLLKPFRLGFCFMKNGLTHIRNHFTMKVRKCILPKLRKGEKKDAEKPRKKRKKKTASVPTQEK